MGIMGNAARLAVKKLTALYEVYTSPEAQAQAVYQNSLLEALSECKKFVTEDNVIGLEFAIDTLLETIALARGVRRRARDTAWHAYLSALN